MRRNLVTSLAVIAGVVGVMFALAAPTVATSPQQAGPQRGPFKPVADVHYLMEAQGEHLDGIVEALKEQGDKMGKTVRFHAEVLAELSNVNRYNQDKEDYIGWATQLRDAALTLAKEAGKDAGGDVARMAAMVETMKQTCASCHDAYD